MTSLSPFQHKMTATTLLPSSASSYSSVVVPRLSSHQKPIYSTSLKLKTPSLTKLSVKCSSSSNTPGSDETGSKGVLDAFFLGKALAEAINERVESTVGELLSVVGRFQAEQQKQVQEFQEDVLERAKRAKEKAAREALEAHNLAPKSTTVIISTATDVASPAVSQSPAKSVTQVTKFSNNDPLLGMMLSDD